MLVPFPKTFVSKIGLMGKINWEMRRKLAKCYSSSLKQFPSAPSMAEGGRLPVGGGA